MKKSCVNSIVYYYNDAQRYEQFLQVGQLYRALILLGLALSSERLSLVFMVLYIIIFCLHPSLCVEWDVKPYYTIPYSLPFSELSLVGLALDVV